MSNKNKIESWINKCADSNGTMVMFPDGMSDKGDEFIKKSEEFLAKAREFDKMNAEFDVFAKNFWHQVRLGLEKAGVKEAFSRNVGWNEQARKDEIKVLNVIPNGPAQMR